MFEVEKPDLRPERADLKLERADLEPEADSRFERQISVLRGQIGGLRADLRSEG